MESLSKKFYSMDQERHKLDEMTIEKEQKLLKTIRISKNLFSLTERLPKSKYASPSPRQDRHKVEADGTSLPYYQSQHSAER